MRKLLYIIVATILLAACSGGGRERAALDAAQAVINRHPDSALAILDSLVPSSNGFPHPTLRRWQLLRLMAQNKESQGQVFDSFAQRIAGTGF